jgi:hypothetical protein
VQNINKMPGGTVTLAIESIKAPINKAVPPPRIKATFSPPRQLNSKNITAKDRILRHSIDRIPLSSSNSSEFIKDDKVLGQSNDLPLVAYKAPVTKREKNNIINENNNSDKSITSKKLPEILFKPIPKVKGVYRYRLMPGNNVRAVLSALRVRPWWHPASKSDDDDVSSAAAQAAFPSFIWEQYRCPKRYKDDTYKDTILNHLNNNNCLVSKKGLYFSLKIYCAKEGINLLDIVPRTFYLSPSGLKSTVGNEPDDLKEFMDFVATKKKSPTVCNDGFKEEKDNVFDSAALDSPTTRSISSVDVESVMKVPILAIEKSENDLIWILKPARLTNRGYGIQVVKGTTEVLDVVNKTITSRASTADGDTEEKLSEKEATEKKIGILTKIANKNGAKEGWIVQEYMERPLLVNGRKFDIRCFVLLTHCRSKGLKAYFFNQAYVRTSCRKYNLENLDDRETHLTNDAVQKHSKEYGKFESGNKLNFVEWQESINRDYPGTDTTIVESKIRPEIIRLTTISIKSVAEELNSSNGIVKNTFELLGYDYMVTDKFEPKLIEINSNPCLEFACPLLKEIISNVINSTIKYAVDPILKPPPAGSRTKLCEEAVSLLEQEEERFQQIFP